LRTITETIEVSCPSYYALRHAERYFSIRRRGVAPDTISLHVDFSRLKLPGATEARHDVLVKHELSGKPGEDQELRLSWDPDDAVVPSFVGTLRCSEAGGKAMLTLNGAYKPPLGAAGAAFDLVAGRHIALATMRALLEDVKQFIESDFQTALSTELASSPKE
jgi:hypothetical protein